MVACFGFNLKTRKFIMFVIMFARGVCSLSLNTTEQHIDHRISQLRNKLQEMTGIHGHVAVLKEDMQLYFRQVSLCININMNCSSKIVVVDVGEDVGDILEVVNDYRGIKYLFLGPSSTLMQVTFKYHPHLHLRGILSQIMVDIIKDLIVLKIQIWCSIIWVVLLRWSYGQKTIIIQIVVDV